VVAIGKVFPDFLEQMAQHIQAKDSEGLHLLQAEAEM
jgi:hypothetical protein